MIRLKSLLSFGSSLDPTWDYVDAVEWTTLELAVAMICACLPAIRNLLVRLWPKAFLTSMRTSGMQKSGSAGWNSNRTPRTNETGEFVELQYTDTQDLREDGALDRGPPVKGIEVETSVVQESTRLSQNRGGMGHSGSHVGLAGLGDDDLSWPEAPRKHTLLGRV